MNIIDELKTAKSYLRDVIDKMENTPEKIL